MFSIVIFIRGVLSAAPAANAVVTRMAVAARMNNFPCDFIGLSFLGVQAYWEPVVMVTAGPAASSPDSARFKRIIKKENLDFDLKSVSSIQNQ